ncbi:MAG: bifunctional (p)ppGpp synthetase/guanosine-3',5'-bis(diphosphate) 3'-pyrophosphohydrolase [Rhodobiaceae bacterium]|jgi:RelA/SpoT family (p)ppGpp synthetase|nr:bifunctional (p)ppGpp synthetase/guanosine-3',5'-bis(diphosphate) 3'-pyrophosphohydrolase [Rhodobiaceae bacterium]|tara:strand:- start:5235 stop:7346 length:2112 start_codon:yes stop_codon:yes gene_type:complete
MRQYELVDRVLSYNPKADESLINKAYVYGTKMHGVQLRESGDPYFSHPLEVAGILTELKLDTSSVICALLHDTIEDTHATIKDIEKNFGKEVAKLVDGVSKLNKFENKNDYSKAAENFRKLIIASSSDLRVLLIKLADRLHNMRTLRFLKDKNRRKRIARETLEIYAPLAARIGMHSIREELEDLSFAETEPEIRSILFERIKKSKKRNNKIVKDIEKIISDKLSIDNLEVKVTGREKTVYSIWKKLENKNKSLEQLSDLFAFRIYVENLFDCYKVLGILHNNWQAVPGLFKDYISTPKKNGYQSIHTTLIGPRNRRIEIQIRTNKMHELNEKGLAAHWAYKEKGNANDQYLASMAWISDLVDILQRDGATEEFLENTRLELSHEQVYCFTPKGRLIALPSNASALDFAFAVHSDLGIYCSGVKINGEIKPRRTKLVNGDEVEIIKSRTPVPIDTFEDIVVTGKSKSTIRRTIKENKIKNQRLIGKEIIKSIFSSHRKKPTRDILERSFGPLNVRSLMELYEIVGRGETSGSEVYDLVYPKTKRKKRKKRFYGKDLSLPISGLLPDMSVRFQKNSFLIPGDNIVGIVTPSEGITIYSTSSKDLIQYEDNPERWLRLNWKKEIDVTFTARILLSIINEIGALGSITSTIADYGGNITNLNLNEKDTDFYNLRIDVDVNDNIHISNIIQSLRGLPVIDSVERILI